MMIKKCFAILLLAIANLIAYCHNAAAQTNVVTETNLVTVTVTNVITITNVVTKTEDLAKAESASKTNEIVKLPKHPWESSITAGLTLTRGNSQTLLVTGGIQTHRKTPKDEIGLGADGGYGTSGSEKNVDTIHGVGQYNHLSSKKFYGYTRVEGLHDGVADLQYRITIGPGVGYYFLKETNTTFAGELGSSYVAQRLGSADESYATLRAAERFEHKFDDFGARIWENVEVLPQVDKFNNLIINAEVGIESSLTKSLSLKTFLVDNFNNEPASGRQKNDVKLVSGITYKF
jgi:putative salt-induced outer membrane protein YdiY